MSLKIIRPGLLDTIQDMGRFGYQQLGINPGGAMDIFAMQVANILVGNDLNEAIIEMHYPASTLLLESDAIIAVSGADFSLMINGDSIPLNRPVIVGRNSVLQFNESKKGARAYLAIKGGLQLPLWLDSASANLKAELGGFLGKTIQQNDMLYFKEQNDYSSLLNNTGMKVLSWKADTNWDIFSGDYIYLLPGNELNWLDDESKKNFSNGYFTVTSQSDRMGFRLSGEGLNKINNEELVSSAVSFGTIQLLPNGQLIILMADHQTTGGYPRVAHVITAHHSKLAQVRSGEKISFRFTDIKTAEELLLKQHQHLKQLESACKFRLEEFLKYLS